MSQIFPSTNGIVENTTFDYDKGGNSIPPAPWSLVLVPLLFCFVLLLAAPQSSTYDARHAKIWTALAVPAVVVYAISLLIFTGWFLLNGHPLPAALAVLDL